MPLQSTESRESNAVAVATPDEVRATETAREITDFDDSPVDITDFDQTDSLAYARVPNPLRHPLQFAWWITKSLFGIATLILLLAVFAAIPIAGLLVLGYLLEVEARVARTGKLRFGFPLLHIAPRIGAAVLGIGLWMLPLFALADLQASAQLIDPEAVAASRLMTAKVIVGALIAVHLCLAVARGATFGCFFRPIKNVRWLLAELRNKPLKNRKRCPHCGESLSLDDEFCTLCLKYAGGDATADSSAGEGELIENTYWHRADHKVRRFVQDFRLKHHFLLGWRGFVAALAVLLLPTILYAAASRTEPLPVLVTVFGGFCLAFVFQYVPFLQARVAVENRISAVKQLGTVRELFRYAPLAWFIAALLTFALALPPYLVTTFAAPEDVMWLIAIVYIVTLYPARVAVGWAYGRALRKQREGRRHAWWGFRWVSRVLILATTVFFTFIFFFIRDISSHGRLVLFEHHAFLGTVLSSLFSLLP